MNKDTVVGILGAVILVAAMVGIFYYEGTQAPGATGTPGTPGGSGPFAVSWTTAEKAGTPTAGTNDWAGTATTSTVNITGANITKISFEVAWAANPVSSESVTVSAAGPGGLKCTGTASTTSPAKCDVTVGSTPAVNRTGGADEASASSALAAQYTTTNGTGAWTVTITVTNQVPVPPGTPLPAGNTAWTLTPKVTSYSAAVSRAP